MARAGKGPEGRINMAAAAQPKSGHTKPAAAAGGSRVGNETKAATRAAGLGAGDSVVGTTSLSGAVGHLMNDHASGSAHMPLHGMKSSGSW
jgi:hypothetical protein